MTKEISYSHKYIVASREDLIKALKNNLSKDRFEHCLRVESTAIELAQKYQLNRERAGIAGLLHDYAKEDSLESLKSYAHFPGFDEEWVNYGNAIWHGPLATMKAVDDFGLHDLEIYYAIYKHTTGSINWTDTAKLVFLADYMEPGRDFPGVDKARDLTERSIDLAVDYKIKENLKHLIEKGQSIYPESLAVYNAWINKKGKSEWLIN